MVKELIRALGIDDCPFQLREDMHTRLVGVIYRGNSILEDVLSTTIEVDGLDSTDKIIEMIKHSKFSDQLRVIFLSGITFGGFNTVNIKELYNSLKIPVIVILDKKPNYEKIKLGASRIRNYERIIELINIAGNVVEIQTFKGRVYFQISGVESDKAVNLITIFQGTSKIPEPLRAAQLIAKIFKRENNLN